MKMLRPSLFVLLLALCASAAFADSIPDPKIIIRGVGGGGAPTVCPPRGCTEVGFDFMFTVPQSGKGNVFFTNASGKNWTSLRLIETGVPAEAITCSQNMFLSCTIRTLENGAVEILLSGVQGDTVRNGIQAGQNFVIGFQCVNDSCWPGGLTFSGHASAAPEPGTIALVVTGIGAIVSRRKRWLNRSKV